MTVVISCKFSCSSLM